MANSTSNASLAASVTSLRSSLSLLDSSISILDAGIADFPRMKTVLSSTRHFELSPQNRLQAAQDSLKEELEPTILTLLQKAEMVVARLERRESQLIARSELLEGRLGEGADAGGELRKKRSLERMVRRAAGSAGGNNGKGGKKGNEEMLVRLKGLRQRKERLGYAVERLGLQSQQRQRQLRMSVAGGAVMNG